MPLSAGTLLGQYEILAPLGAGGMGEVYRARDTKLKRDVAIKVLPDSVAHDADRMARFQREAEVLASLNHPNIAAIYGVEDRALVMELVEGENLKGPLPIETAVNYASQIALALEAAHDKGIVHRDLKPANIKVTPSGAVKVLDFGLAAVAQASTNDANPANSPTLTMRATQAGFIMGTAAYMSPEQAAAKPVDHRADIWSFGVVLWEMLTGRQLFDGETVSHTLAAVLTKDPDWTQLPAGTPANIRRLLHRCLERDLKRRLRDIGDAWVELNTQEEPASQPTPRERSFAAHWLPWAIAAFFAAAAIGWGVLNRPRALPQQVIRWRFTQENPFGMPAISRDGTHLAYSELNGPTIRLMLRSMDQAESKPIQGTETGGVGGFSPDGQWIAYFSGLAGGAFGTSLKKISINGGAPISICECTGAAGISWGDDGTIVYSDGKKLMRVSDGGGTPQALTTPDTAKGETAHVYPFFLPGAQAVLFTVNSKNIRKVALLDLKKGGYRVIVDSGTNPQYVSAGYLTFVQNSTLFAVRFDPKKLALIGSPRPVVEGVMSITGGVYGEYAVSENGLLVYMSGQTQGNVTVLGWVDGRGVPDPISPPQHWGNGRLSPDGLRIVNSINNGATSDIWIFDVERRTLNRLTYAGDNVNPIWMPDGRRVTYYSASSGTSGIYSIAADGSGKPELLVATERSAALNSWTRDGKTLVFTENGADKVAHLWTLSITPDAAQRKPALLHDTSFAESDAEISPDGRWIAYVSEESGSSELYVQPFPGPGAKIRISTQGGISPRWSHDVRQLFYWTPNRGTLLSVDVQAGPAFRAGVPREVFQKFMGTTWDVAQDGKRFLLEFLPANLRMETVVNWFDELRRSVPAGK